MHELAVTEGILDVALKHARQAGAARIVGINMVIGQLAAVVDDSIQFYWDIISEGTIAQGAALHFQRVPAEMYCMNCGHAFVPSKDSFECPLCLSLRVRVSKGDELRVESVDIE